MSAKTRPLDLESIKFDEVLRCQIFLKETNLGDAEIAQIFEGCVENLAIRAQRRPGPTSKFRQDVSREAMADSE